MMESLGYLFYPVVFGLVLWCNLDALKLENSLVKAVILTFLEFCVLFGSWLLAIWQGIVPLLICNLGGALLLAVIAVFARKNASWRRAGISGGILFVVWGCLSALLNIGI